MRIPLLVPIGLVALGAVSASGGQDLPIGAARVDITPDGPIRPGGSLARDAESRGVGQRIWANAVAIGGEPGVEGLVVEAVRKAAGPGFGPPAPRAGDEAMPPPLAPDESLRAFRAKPGLKVELVAAEPLVESPVAVDFGADGRLWVCEMRDYPTGLDSNGKPGGRIKVLEDRDRDGRYETATVFLEDLPFPTGVMAWRKGVLVCAAPEILYAEDIDGDGKADVRRVLYRGFATENYQARVNGLAYGLDNWVYGANGLIGGKIRGLADGREVDIGGRDFRFKPDSGEFEPASGLTQQGRVRDDWGNQFGGNNSVLIQHYPLPDHDARRNPRVAAPSPAVALARGPDPSLLFPASRTLARYNDPGSANHATSACSPAIYRDTLLGPGLAGNAFACEPVHNLVGRLVLEPEGVTFAGRRAEDERAAEFLASTDPWCRPVQVRTGPDGALWVVDMYRFVIEHPRWISPERLAGLDVRAGAERGRIYRVVPEGRPARPVPRLDDLPTRDLAAALDGPNGTLRDNVQRLLVHRADRASAPVLKDLAKGGEHPEGRAQALGALDGIGALESESLLGALADPHPGVRREAARLAAPRLSGDAALGRAVLALADDPAITVRFQVALALGDWPHPEAGRALGRIAARDGGDRWVRAAVLSSATPHAGAILAQVLASAGPRGPLPALIEPLVATAAGAGDRRALAGLLDAAGATKPEPWRLGAIAALLDGPDAAPLADDPAVLSAIAAARRLAAETSGPPGGRVAAIRLLGRVRAGLDADREALVGRLDPGEPSEVQLAAIRGLTRLGDPASAAALLARWPRLGPSARASALDALLAREETAEVLLAALEAGRIAPAQVDAAHRERLLSNGPDPRRRRAAEVFGTLAIGPRKAVLDAYASAKTLPGDPARGRAVFERACASCHKLGGVGHEVGPDLAALTDTSPDALLTAILDPNREVDARYAVYVASMKDGRVVDGLILAETAGAVMLKRQEGQADSILRSDLDELTTQGRSLMPEGLENDLKPTDLADLIAFVALRPKTLAGNRPQTVAPRPDGSIRLAASTAEIYGPSLVYETEFGNLGYWHSEGDRASWTFRVDRPSTFTVSMDWACDDAVAGNAFLLRIDDQAMRGTVGGTGRWSDYRTLFLREVRLAPGDHRLDLRPAGPVRGALADVRTILLSPRGARTGPPPSPAAAGPDEKAGGLALRLLDPATKPDDREAILRDHPEMSADFLAAFAEGVGPDQAEEYRRIPWIWRVTIAAGRRNDEAEIRRLLAISLPDDGRPLDHWRAVAVGGGLINGISQAGDWPGARIEAILGDDAGLSRRWRRALNQASAMADAESVPAGTRYDALRMIGLEGWERRGPQLVRYLAGGVAPELQMGAISALGDMPSPRVTEALLSGLERYTPANRKLSIAALARDNARREALLDAVASGRLRADELDEGLVRLLIDPTKNRPHVRAKEVLNR